MAPGARSSILLSCLKGLVIAILTTLAGMCLLAGVVMCWGMPDTALTIANQLLKIVSIFVGALFAVRPGGERGAAKGAVTGLTYMLLGYGLYAIWGRGALSYAVLVGEFLSGTIVGALSGAIVANWKPRRSARTPSRARKRAAQG